MSSPASAAALRDLAPTGRLRVALAVSTAGGAFWSARDAAGVLSGVPVYLGTAFGEQLAVPVDYVCCETSAYITDAAAHDEWDVTFVPMDDERARLLDFGTVYHVTEGTFIVRAGLAAATFDELDATDAHIAAVGGTTTARGAARALHRAKIRGYDNYETIIAGLAAGDIDAFAFSRDNLEKLAATIPGTRVLPETFQQTRIAGAVPKGRAAGLGCLCAFIDDARSNGVLRRALDANGLTEAAIP